MCRSKSSTVLALCFIYKYSRQLSTWLSKSCPDYACFPRYLYPKSHRRKLILGIGGLIFQVLLGHLIARNNWSINGGISYLFIVYQFLIHFSKQNIFTDEKTQVQRSSITCSRSHVKAVNPEFGSRYVNIQMPISSCHTKLPRCQNTLKD